MNMCILGCVAPAMRTTYNAMITFSLDIGVGNTTCQIKMMKFVIVILLHLHYFSLTTAEQNPLCAHDKRSPETSLLYHEETRKCYRAQGKCDGLMLFYPAGDGYGECDCDINLEQSEGREIVYWRPYNRCYRIYERGPCRRREWLELDKETGKVICKSNPCFQAQQRNPSTDTSNFWFYEFGRCWKNGMRGNCPHYPDFRIYYSMYRTYNFDEYGNCLEIAGGSGSLVSTGALPCKPGHKFYGNYRKCKRAAKVAPNYYSFD